MKAVAIILSIIVFTACLIIGIQAGNASIPGITRTPTSPSASPSGTTGQRTYVLIGVDELASENPRLVSLWVVFFRPGLSQLSALSVYPRAQISASTGTPDLPSSFSLTPEKMPAPGFIDELLKYHFTWDGLLVIDKVGTRILIDWLGGLDLNGSHSDGSSVISSLSDPWTDQLAALDGQKSVGQGICSAAGLTAGKIDWQGLRTALIPEHLTTSMDAGTLQEELTGLLTTSEALQCDFPD